MLARRKKRQDSLIKKIIGRLYHKIISGLTNNNIPGDVGDFRLMDKKVVQAIRLMPEKTRYMKGIFAWVGFKTTIMEFDRPARNLGRSKIGFRNLVKLGLDGIFSFSTKPLKIWLYIGLVISTISLMYALFLILRTLIFGVDLPGYPSIMVSMLFIGGIQLISLGVIGEYIARIYKETKQRPIYIVQEEYGTQEKQQLQKANQQKIWFNFRQKETA